MRSIRGQFVVGGIAVIGLVLACAGAGVYWALQRSLQHQFDETLLNELAVITSQVEVDEEGLRFDGEDFDWRDFSPPSALAFLEILTADGAVLFRSESVDGHALDHEEPDFEPSLTWRDVDGRRIRFASVQVAPRIDPDVLAEETSAEAEEDGDDEDEAADGSTMAVRVLLGRADTFVGPLLGRVRSWVVIVLLGAVLLNAALMFGVGRSALRDLDRLAETMRALPVNGAAEPVPAEIVPVEARPIVDRLNELLARVARSMARERAFSANVAHELRTPIAGLRSLTEVALHRDRTGDEYRSTLRDGLRIVLQTEDTVEKLLHLHRLEAGQVVPDSTGFDLSELVEARWRSLQARAASRHLRVDLRLLPNLIAHSDASLWALAVDNVLDNAISHSDEGGAVSIRTLDGGSGACLVVANSGSRSESKDVPMLLERFTRGDPSRGSSGTHVGLGLALVRRIAEITGSRLEIETEPGGEFSVSLHLPPGSSAPRADA